MKKVSIKLLAKNEFDQNQVLSIDSVIELNEFHESVIKHEDIASTYSFDYLLDSGKTLAQGIWYVGKGLTGVSMWAVVCIVEGLKALWKFTFDEKKKGKGDINENGKVQRVQKN